jgi:3-hydroxyacyl-CoA dehydrogenase
MLSTHSLDNRTAAAYNTDVSSGLHEVGSANSLALVEVILAQKHAAEALQRVVGAASDLSITQEQ